MKNVAVVGASGAVGQRMIQLLEERSFPVESIIFLASAQERRSVGCLPRPVAPDSRALGRSLRWGRHRACRAHPQPSRGSGAPGRRAGRGRRRQLERISHGARGPVSRARGQPRRHPETPGHHRQPQLLDHSDGRRAKAAARLCPNPTDRRQHISVGLGRRHERHPRARFADQGQRGRCPPGSPIQVCSPDLRATAFPRSTTSCRAATPRRR